MKRKSLLNSHKPNGTLNSEITSISNFQRPRVDLGLCVARAFRRQQRPPLKMLQKRLAAHGHMAMRHVDDSSQT